MYQNKKILAIITARSGSKRFPGKNIKNLAGKPLIAWTIDEAKKSKYIDKLIISTDDEVIANITRQHGTEVPFIRPVELATDTASSVDVLKHAMEFYQNQYDYILLLQPTSPLRQVTDIDKAIEELNSDTKAVISVCLAEHSPLWSNILPNNLSMADFIKDEVKNKRSQDLPDFYRINGAIYIAESAYFRKQNGFIGVNTKAFIMSNLNSIDIDTELDFLIAETIIKNNLNA